MSKYRKYIQLLQKMVATPSFSREEDAVADIIYSFLQSEGIKPERVGNNVWACGKIFIKDRHTVLLNSHIDTVKPNSGYSRDPFDGAIENGKLWGLGSNDAGASVVSLIAAFCAVYKLDLGYNVVLGISCQEEISGDGGVEMLLPKLPKIDVAIVGEPTKMEMAICERGLMVLDCVAHGKSGHAARDEGENAIYNAIKDIEWFKKFQFERKSNFLGSVKMSVTVINSGKAHNVVPDECEFVVDVRVPECYNLEEVLEVIKNNVKSDVKPRSLRIRPAGIANDHKLVCAGKTLGKNVYGSPTTSDGALMKSIDVLKIGVGDSARSHTADEYVYVNEIEQGIEVYIKLLQKYTPC